MSSHTKGKNELTEMFLEKMNILNRRFLDVIEDAVRRLPCCDLVCIFFFNIFLFICLFIYLCL